MSRRIYTRLVGGLGNQLFQYAAGRAAVNTVGGRLIVDGRYVPEPDLLARFGVQDLVMYAPDMPPHKRQRLAYFTWRALRRAPKILREFKTFNLGDPYPEGSFYLHGYWQYRTLVEAAQIAIAKPASVIVPARTANEVCLHVRGGDYLTIKSRRQHAILGAEYYNEAVQKMRADLGDLSITLFTNDPDHARSLALDFDYSFAAPELEADAVTCLWAMAQFKNFVAANSTFSWWASYLAGPDARVIFPPNLLVK